MNFGIIIDSLLYMRTVSFISLIFFGIVFSLHGQDNNTITEFDLYGCWVIEESENWRQRKKQVYKRCEQSDSELAIKRTRISLQAYNKSEIQQDSHFICFTTTTEVGSWTFDKENRIVSIFYGQEFLKELEKLEPDIYKEFDSLDEFEWKKFKVLSLSENQMEVEIY